MVANVVNDEREPRHKEKKGTQISARHAFIGPTRSVFVAFKQFINMMYY